MVARRPDGPQTFLRRAAVTAPVLGGGRSHRGGWPCCPRACGPRRPNSKLCHACIGVTRMGHNDLKNFLQHERVQIVALCDVDTEHLDKAAKLVPGARRYTDWRELLDKEGDKIDSVNVTVPDHMHFPIAYCGDPAGQARLLPEADVPRRGRGPAADRGGREERHRHPARHAASPPSIGDRMTVQLLQERRDRQDQARLSVLQPRGARTASRARARPRRRAAAASELGPVDRHGADAAVCAGHLPPGEVARLAGLRHQLVRRHGLPHLRRRLEGLGSQGARRP